MNEGELLYFTQAELEIMLDLSVGAAHTLYRIGPPPDDDALTAAFTSLYQRGFLTREGDTLSPAPKAGFFRRMGAAPFAVTLKTRYPRPAVVLLYGGGETLCRKKAMIFTPGEMCVIRLTPEQIRSISGSTVTGGGHRCQYRGWI